MLSVVRKIGFNHRNSEWINPLFDLKTIKISRVFGLKTLKTKGYIVSKLSKKKLMLLFKEFVLLRRKLKGSKK